MQTIISKSCIIKRKGITTPLCLLNQENFLIQTTWTFHSLEHGPFFHTCNANCQVSHFLFILLHLRKMTLQMLISGVKLVDLLNVQTSIKKMMVLQGVLKHQPKGYYRVSLNLHSSIQSISSKINSQATVKATIIKYAFPQILRSRINHFAMILIHFLQQQSLLRVRM